MQGSRRGDAERGSEAAHRLALSWGRGVPECWSDGVHGHPCGSGKASWRTRVAFAIRIGNQEDQR